MQSGPGPSAQQGIPPDKRTMAYESIFGRPTAKPKGPQPPGMTMSAGVGPGPMYRPQPPNYGNQRWNNGMSGYPGYTKAYADPTMMGPAPSQAHHSMTQYYGAGGFAPSTGSSGDSSYNHDGAPDRRASTVPSMAGSDPRASLVPSLAGSDPRASSVPSLAGSDPRMSIASYSHFGNSLGSAADAYRLPSAGITPASAYASHYMSNDGRPSGTMAGGGYSNPNTHSPRSSMSSLLPRAFNADQAGQFEFPSSGPPGRSASIDLMSAGVGRMGVAEPPVQHAPPRLPSIELSRDEQDDDKSEFWFNNSADGEGAKTPTSPESKASGHANAAGPSPHADTSVSSAAHVADSRATAQQGNDRTADDSSALLGADSTEDYSQGFYDNLFGQKSAASSIYGDGRRRGSFESDRQSVANSIYTLPGAQTASRNFHPVSSSNVHLPSGNGAGYFGAHGSGFSTLAPYGSVGGSGWDRPPRMRTASSATQAAQAAYAPGFANSASGWNEQSDLPKTAGSMGRADQRSMSFGQAASRPSILPSATSPHGSVSGSKAHTSSSSRKGPLVYPALLSKVAEAFRNRVTLSERAKDGLTYSDAFDGREAVDRIAYIIKTTDRNLALLLGRALDAQKFFHDVTYDHRLRDSPNEIYQFKVRVPTSGFGAENGLDGSGDAALKGRGSGPQTFTRDNSATSLNPAASISSMMSSKPGASPRSPDGTTPATSIHHGLQDRAEDKLDDDDDDALPTGVFTLLTDCYSPTCTRDRLCYSIACPRRLEQQARLNMKPQPGLKRTMSKESLGEPTVERGTLWAESVSKDVFENTPDTERKRQEAINEVMYTERDFVADLEYLRDLWIKPLRSQDIIPEDRRDDFVTQVFWNVLEIHAVNARMSELLNKRQKQSALVDRIGDILLEMVPHFQPFVKYGAHQLYGKYEFEKEKASNPAFAKFVEETERLPQSRKLELNGYLTKPTTRLARYPLLLEQVVKYTADDHPDKQALPRVIKIIKEFLTKVNVETGKSENRFNLAQLDQQLVFKQGEAVDLRLRDEQRELVFKGPLKRRGGTQSESAELQVFLFDHALLMVKPKVVNKHELYKVYRKPIPLELLIVTVYDEVPTGKGNATRPKSVMSKTSTGTRLTGAPGSAAPKQDAKTGYALTFTYLGKKGYSMTLWASTFVSRRKWFEHIEARQEILRQRSNIFDTITLSEGFFAGPNRVNCSVPFDFGRRIIYGTDDGVYLSDLREKARPPTKVLPLPGVTQVDVLEEYQILIVLAEKSVHTFTLDALDPSDPMGSLKRGRRISSHTSFFRAGICLGRTLVCVVKSSSLSSTIKTLEPIEQNVRGKKQPTFRKLLQGGQETLRVFKEFYIPTESSSIHFLKSKLCVGCTKGFEIVDLETLDTQGLLDPDDSSLDFVHRKETVKPIAIYRITGEFLLCYDEFAFYVNKNGWRAKGNWIIHWEGNPTSFAYHHPYVLAFEPNFVEVRHVETGALHQVITGVNLRCLFADVPPPAPSRSQQNAAAMAAMQQRPPPFGSMIGPYGRPVQQYPGFPGARPGFPPGALPMGMPPGAPGPPPYGGRPVLPAGPGPGSGPPFGGPASQLGTPQGPVVHPAYAARPPAMPYAFSQPPPPPRPPPVQRNPVWESVAASRNQIVFIGDTTVFCVRLHTENEKTSGEASPGGSNGTAAGSGSTQALPATAN
ncbi:RHO1 GDP-GTP exchange protein 2 [Thecaphora frezii]